MYSLAIVFGVKEVGLLMGFFLLLWCPASGRCLCCCLKSNKNVASLCRLAISSEESVILYRCTNLQSEFLLGKSCYRQYNPNPKSCNDIWLRYERWLWSWLRLLQKNDNDDWWQRKQSLNCRWLFFRGWSLGIFLVLAIFWSVSRNFNSFSIHSQETPKPLLNTPNYAFPYSNYH